MVIVHWCTYSIGNVEITKENRASGRASSIANPRDQRRESRALFGEAVVERQRPGAWCTLGVCTTMNIFAPCRRTQLKRKVSGGAGAVRPQISNSSIPARSRARTTRSAFISAYFRELTNADWCLDSVSSLRSGAGMKIIKWPPSWAAGTKRRWFHIYMEFTHRHYIIKAARARAPYLHSRAH